MQTWMSKVVYVSSSFWLLAIGSRDLSQAKKKITVAKAELLKMTIFGYFMWTSFVINYFFLSLR